MLLIDGDVVAFRCAASCEPTSIKPYREPLEMAIRRADELMYRIFADMNTDSYKGYLTGSGNFRKVIDPTYKANRTRPAPVYLNDLRQFMMMEWKMECVEGYEADDAIGMAATDDTVICSNDKDLRQIPGGFYNFTTHRFEVIDEVTAAQVPYWLLLVGDRADNIVGVSNIGKVKADRIILNFGDNIHGLHDHVKKLYNDDDRFEKNMLLVRVLRTQEQLDQMNELIKELNENKLSETEGETATAVSSAEDFSPFSTVNS